MTRWIRATLTVLMGLWFSQSPLHAATPIETVSAPSQAIVLASGITTDTTSAVSRAKSGRKTIFGEVVCTSGACVQTQAVYGTFYPTAVNGVLLCTLTLSGTTRAQDACPVATFAFPRLYVITTATSGTAATGAVYVGY